MSLKSDAKPWTIKEQIIEDPVSGLSFQFEVMPDRDLPVLRVFGDFRFGNREFIFNQKGEEAGAGTCTRGSCRPSWLEKID